MGVFRDPITINNVGAVGSTTNPLTGSALGMDRENQKAIKELIGTLDWESLSILDGGITPVSSEIIVDTEDGTPADDLTTINLTSDGSTTLHTGMRIKIKSADPSRVITVKHLTGGGNIRTADGQDVVLSNDWSLDFKLQNGDWVEQKGRGYKIALDAQADASTALARTAPATTTSRGIGRVATRADLDVGATITNGPAFLAAGDVVSVIEEVIEGRRFVVGEFYYFRHPTLKPGFAPLQGGLITGNYQGKNITEYPIWAYLQTAEGQLLCKTEAEWQAMTKAVWHTNADGSKVGWDGIGGAPFFAPNWETGELRLPDLRGMYMEAAGFDGLNVGGVHGDGIRRVVGCYQIHRAMDLIGLLSGPYYASGANNGAGTGVTGSPSYAFYSDNKRVVPVANQVQPRAYGVLACVYLGVPR